MGYNIGMKSLKDRIFYKYKYLGESEKHGQTYEKYKKVSRLSLIRKRVKVLMFILLILVVIVLIYLSMSSFYIPKPLN